MASFRHDAGREKRQISADACALEGEASEMPFMVSGMIPSSLRLDDPFISVCLLRLICFERASSRQFLTP